MAKTYDHAVKFGGKIYPPNTPIVEKKAAPAQAQEKPRKPTKGRGKGEA
jgi:hypothetical protein|nr:MAG TPA: hypothetical protein [Bacteriophage sp.]DAT66175.1 MAG TPA: hypothetical protein [Caudoviricetes sp.]